MPTLIQYLLAIGTFQGFLLSALLLFTPQVSSASRILGVWCSLLAMGLLSVMLVRADAFENYSLLIGGASFLPASYGALLYLYCRHSVLDDRFQARDLLHFIPIAVCYLLNVDLLLAPGELAELYIQDTSPATLGFALGRVILFVQAYVYIGYCGYFLYRFQRLAQHNYAGFNPDVFDWLWIVQAFNLVIWTCKAAALVSPNFILVVAGDLLIIVLIYGIALAQWRNPQLFRIAASAQERSLITEQERTDKIPGALDDATRASLMQTVVDYMKSQQAYLDSELSLRRLSEAVDISTHHLSEVLNQEEGKNFYNFVNDLRVEHVCERLKRDNDVKLLDLGMQAGFSSKSTFNSVFKKHTGMTPSQYRKNQTEEA